MKKVVSIALEAMKDVTEIIWWYPIVGLIIMIIAYNAINKDMDNKEFYYASYQIEDGDTLSEIIKDNYAGTETMNDIGYNGIKKEVLKINTMTEDDTLYADRWIVLPYYPEDRDSFTK